MKSANVKKGLKVLVVALMGGLVTQGALAQNASPTKVMAVEKKTPEAKTISEADARLIAEKKVPGKVVDVAIEKKRGANRYVVEVRPTAGGPEVDVIIDMASGKVLAVEK